MAARQCLLLLIALVVGSTASSCTSDSTGSNVPVGVIQLSGAGATFPAPLYKKWIEEYQRDHAQVLLSYKDVGSGEGIKKFIAGTIDFGASDAAMSDEQIAEVEPGVQLVPATAGIIVLAYNLAKLGGDLKLTRDLYVNIFLGRIKKWNDARIKAVNPGLTLPNEDIVMVVRQDSGGTTYAFTNHLSTISEEWRDRGPGRGSLINWPGNVMQVPGNEGVAGRIKLSRGAIGYLAYGFAKRTGLSMAWLENKEGQFVQPREESGVATLRDVQMPDNLRIFAPDPPGKESYPIVTYSWLLLYKKYRDPQKSAALKEYVKWNLTKGQEFSESLGYIPLPPAVTALAMAAVDNIQ